MLVIGHDEAVTRWVGARLRIEDFGPWRSAIGVAIGAELVAGAVFTHYNNRCDIQVTFAASTPRWATRGAIRGILAYPFVQLRCRRLTAITEAGNLVARRFLDRLGFHMEGYHRDAFADDDGVSYGMLRQECRWLEDLVNVDEPKAA